nr:MAG TPA: hypothetical protein [Caudoviricetes sp.]
MLLLLFKKKKSDQSIRGTSHSFSTFIVINTMVRFNSNI